MSKKLLSLLLCLAMVVCLFAACGETKTPDPTEAPKTTDTPTETPEPTEAPEEPKTLVVGYSYFSSKFSPFFASTAYDEDVYSMTQLSLIGSDREGNMILNGIEGETVAYNGTDYTYTGISDTEVVQNDDGTVDYNITLRDDIVFSDGEPMTADDVIFSMYVLSDPTYDGSSTFYALPIEGMEEYRSGMSSLGSLIFAAGEDNTDYTYFTAEQQQTYWDSYKNDAVKAFAQEIVDYCVANYSSYLETCGNNDVALGMFAWGFGSVDDNGVLTDKLGKTYDLQTQFPTIDDYAENLVAAYNGDYATLSATESAGSSLEALNLTVLPAEYSAGVQTGDSAPSITGITKTGDYSVSVHMTKFSAVAIYQLSLSVAPLHYYGDVSLYDYDNNMFGFTKGDLSIVKNVTTKPLGAGPYVFESFENGVVTFTANEKYYKGCPKTPIVLFQETAEADKLTGVATGTFDISDPSFSTSTVEYLKDYNGGDITGDVITTVTVDNLGYGYIGISAKTVNVDGEPGSDASKDLRKAFATVLAVYRDTVIESYYGDRASIINYPISNTSWAAPKPADEGYQVAFSVDVDGNPIYTAEMTETEKYDAALQAAIGFLKAAGYTWDDATSTFTAPAPGASMAYELFIPGDGVGDHPAYGIATAAKEALATIGITLEVNDVSDANIMWDAMDAGTAEMWCAAWQSTVDPDMTQVYYSTNAIGEGGSDSNKYCIQDPELDKLIDEGKSSADIAFRKATYKEALELIIDWACEIPTYQRQNAVIFSTERVNLDTVTPDITTFWGWMNDIELLEMN